MKSLMLLTAILCPVVVSSHITGQAQSLDSYLAIYCHPTFATTAPQYDEYVTYGERGELEFELSIANEEGTRLIFLPEALPQRLVIEITKDGERLPEESFAIRMGEFERKYTYDTRLTERDYDAKNFQLLEPGIGVKTSLTVKREDGALFSYGSYKIICYFKKGSVRFEDGTDWQGRGGRGGSLFRILRVQTLDDQKRYYISKGNELRRKNQPEKALEAYRKLIEMEPGNMHSYVWLGSTYMQMERYHEAIAAFEKAAPAYVGREHTAFPHSLGFCYPAVGREDKAREILKMFYGEQTTYIDQTIGNFKAELKKRQKK